MNKLLAAAKLLLLVGYVVVLITPTEIWSSNYYKAALYLPTLDTTEPNTGSLPRLLVAILFSFWGYEDPDKPSQGYPKRRGKSLIGIWTAVSQTGTLRQVLFTKTYRYQLLAIC
jgi:hypothetical protein